MLKKALDSLAQCLDRSTDRSVFLWYTTVAFLIRFPFLFRDYIDRDESTFILVAQSWLDGHLPYTHLWDLKPPLAFAFFAAVIFIFGKSFIAIRFLGIIAVAVTAFFSFKIGTIFSGQKTSFWSGIVCIFLLSLFGSLQGVMSEHLSMLCFMPALYILIQKKSVGWYALAGILMGITIMVKLNLAYSVLLMTLFASYLFTRDGKTIEGLLKIAVFSCSALLVVAATVFPYYINGYMEIWHESVIAAPLTYTNANRYPLPKLLPIFVITLSFLVLCWKKKWLDFKSRPVVFVVAAIIGVLVSYYQVGRVNGHYLIQLHPLLIVLVGAAIENTRLFRKKIVFPIAVGLLFLSPIESYMEYLSIVKHKIEKGSFFNGEGFTVPKFLKEQDMQEENVFFLGYHIGYWLLDKHPPTKAATHPSNICREQLFPFQNNSRKTALEEIEYLIDSVRPKIIVTRSYKSIFDKKYVDENNYINDYLKNHYRLKAVVDKANIYVRSD